MSTIFNDFQHYPTPVKVLDKMMIPCAGKMVADLSAGKGDILDYCRLNGAKQTYACEIEKNLQHILKGKGYQMIGEDVFDLTSADIAHVNLIVLNPPFRTFLKHIIHIWKIAPAGCEIITLCNSDSLDKHENKDELYNSSDLNLKITSNYYLCSELNGLIENYGYKDSLGYVFNAEHGAEREANVHVTKIHLFKPIPEDYPEDFNFEDFYFEDYDSNKYNMFIESDGIDGVVRYSELESLVTQVKSAIDMYAHYLKMGEDIAKNLDHCGIDAGLFGFRSYSGKEQRLDYEEFTVFIYKQSWKHVFNKFGASKHLTTTALEKLNKFSHNMSKIPFTMGNILRVVEHVIGSAESLRRESLKTAVESIMDTANRNGDNKNGWKTNKDNILNTYFIVPNIVNGSSNHLTINEGWGYRNRNNLVDDLMKIIYSYKGIKYDSDRHSLKALQNSFDHFRRNYWYEWNDIFEIKFYVKGTAHLKFLHSKDWELLNIAYSDSVGNPVPQFTTKEDEFKYRRKDSHTTTKDGLKMLKH